MRSALPLAPAISLGATVGMGPVPPPAMVLLFRGRLSPRLVSGRECADVEGCMGCVMLSSVCREDDARDDFGCLAEAGEDGMVGSGEGLVARLAR